MHGGEPDSGTQIEQPGEQLRFDRREEQLGKRCRRSEQCGRRERHRHPRPQRRPISLRHAIARETPEPKLMVESFMIARLLLQRVLLLKVATKTSRNSPLVGTK